MSYPAIEVELRDGQVVASGAEPLPANGKGLLVILSPGREGGQANGGIRWEDALNGIRKRQAARGHAPRSAAAVTEQLQRERDSWS